MSNFYCKVEGLDEVMQKLLKLQDLDARAVLRDIAEEGRKVVQAETAKAGFPESSQETGIYHARKSKNSIAVGFSENFEGYKPLWFHNFGYRIHYKGRDGKTHFNGKTYTLHVGCWDEIRSISIEQLAPVLKARVKRYLDSQLK